MPTSCATREREETLKVLNVCVCARVSCDTATTRHFGCGAFLSFPTLYDSHDRGMLPEEKEEEEEER